MTIMPEWLRRNKNTSLVDVDWSRELSAVRIHVERVIGV